MQARWRDHCCCAKAISITYFEREGERERVRVCVCVRERERERVSVAVIIQYATRMRRITSSAAGLALLHFSTLSHNRHDFRKKIY